MDAGATQVGIFSKQVWVLSGERHHQANLSAATTSSTTKMVRNRAVLFNVTHGFSSPGGSDYAS